MCCVVENIGITLTKKKKQQYNDNVIMEKEQQ